MNRRHSELEVLRRVRRHAELRQALVVAEAERTRLAAEESIRGAGERIGAARAALRGALEGELDAPLLRLSAHGALVEERNRMLAVRALAAATPIVDRARRSLADAAAQRRAVELLLERRRAEELQRAQRVEQAALDEIAARSAGDWA